MTTFAELTAENPNIRVQYDEWRALRAQNNEDPLDWGAFRGHAMAIGAPDPGARPPDDFVGEDYKAANPAWTQRWYGTAPSTTGMAGGMASAPSAPPPSMPQPEPVAARPMPQAGMEVVGNDAKNVGKVKQVRETDFVVDRPMLLQRDINVPLSAVQSVEGNRVMLNVPADRADDLA